MEQTWQRTRRAGRALRVRSVDLDDPAAIIVGHGPAEGDRALGAAGDVRCATLAVWTCAVTAATGIAAVSGSAVRRERAADVRASR